MICLQVQRYDARSELVADLYGCPGRNMQPGQSIVAKVSRDGERVSRGAMDAIEFDS